MSTARIHASTLVRQAEGVITAEADGDLVMMSIERGYYYGLDPIGRRIWTLIVEEKAVTEVCSKLQQEFEIDETTCEQEVLEFLSHLAEQSLIRTRDAA